MSQVINFASFSVQKSANERTSLVGVSRGQNFKLKFRKYLSAKNNTKKIESGFTISDDKFTELGLAEHGLIQLAGTSYIAVVNNDDATMLKRTDKLKADSEKGKKFKSTILEDSLLKAGVITEKEGETQFLDLVKIEDAPAQIGDVTVHAIYEIVKGEDTRSDEDKASEAGQEEIDGDTVAPGVDGTAQEDAPAPAPADSVEDEENF